MCLPLKPFKVEREWEHAGLKCAVTLGREGGFRCGYVRVPPSHPSHGKGYNDVEVDVHGGLTFGREEPCAHDDGTGYWFGFDCAHCYDASTPPVMDPAWGESARRIWEIDHDPKYAGGAEEHYWEHDEVVAECERLAEQLAAMAMVAAASTTRRGENHDG